MPLFIIRHVTHYRYKELVRDSANQIILYPIKDDFQEVIKQKITITGNPIVEVYRDYYGNEIGSFTYILPNKELIIDSKIEVTVKSKTMPLDKESKEVQWQHLEQIKNTHPYIDFIKHELFEGSEEVNNLLIIKNNKEYSPLVVALQLNKFVYENFTYNKAVTNVETTIDEVWKLKAGVCQDFAHMLLVMLRIIGIPAKYVSGYICGNKNEMRGQGATHAWVEAYIPFYGWLGIDPTNNCIVNEAHVRLATGRCFDDVSPVKGTYKGTFQHILDVTVRVAYEDEITEQPLAFAAQPVNYIVNDTSSNSYRRNLEMIQQQQQQQQ